MRDCIPHGYVSIPAAAFWPVLVVLLVAALVQVAVAVDELLKHFGIGE